MAATEEISPTKTGPYHEPRTVDELTERNVAVVAELDKTARAKRTPIDRVIDTITDFCGSMGFVWVHLVWFGLWLSWNVLPHLKHFDPYPYPLLLMIINLEAIFLTTFILISQNRQSRLAERRNHLDLQINLLSEQENTKILSMLEAIQKHLDIPGRDPEVAILEASTQPERLVQQIAKVIEREDGAWKNHNGTIPE